MSDNDLPDFTAANEAREQRVIQAIIDFDWGDYGLGDMDSFAHEIKSEIGKDGESDRMDWARALAKDVMLAARPLSLAEMSDSDGKV